MAAAITGTFLLAEAAIARALLRADESSVFVLGRPLHWECAFRSHFGLPCPTCGLTRSVVLTLHGEIARAWNVAPGGPVATLGLLLFAVALLLLAFLQAGGGSSSAWVSRRIRQATLTYGVVAVAVWIGGWSVAFATALVAR